MWFPAGNRSSRERPGRAEARRSRRPSPAGTGRAAWRDLRARSKLERTGWPTGGSTHGLATHRAQLGFAARARGWRRDTTNCIGSSYRPSACTPSGTAGRRRPPRIRWMRSDTSSESNAPVCPSTMRTVSDGSRRSGSNMEPLVGFVVMVVAASRPVLSTVQWLVRTTACLLPVPTLLATAWLRLAAVPLLGQGRRGQRRGDESGGLLLDKLRLAALLRPTRSCAEPTLGAVEAGRSSGSARATTGSGRCALTCRRRLNSEPCRSNIEPGLGAVPERVGCG